MKHPNALVAAGTGALAATIVYVLSVFGVQIPDPPLEVGMFIGSAASALVLFIGRHGLIGLGRMILRGSGR